MTTTPAERLLCAFDPFFPDARTVGSYVGGALLTGSGTGGRVTLRNPATGGLFLDYPDAGDELVAKAADAAVAGQQTWIALSHAARGRVMQDIARAVREQVEPLAQLESLSAGTRPAPTAPPVRRSPARACRGERHPDGLRGRSRP